MRVCLKPYHLTFDTPSFSPITSLMPALLLLFQTGVCQGCEDVGEDVVHLFDLLVDLGVDAVETVFGREDPSVPRTPLYPPLLLDMTEGLLSDVTEGNNQQRGQNT